MIGAGVFAVWAPAALAAGSWLFVGLAVAASVALCNALASAQLAAVHPTSGGTYAYGRAVLGPWWGFAAGWSFVIGKTASCAAMALTFAAYAVPDAWQRPVAAVVVVALAVVNTLGVTRTAAITRAIVVMVLIALAVVVVAAWMVDPGRGVVATSVAGGPPALFAAVPAGPTGVLQAAGLLFFAFAGYARIATMGEEVRDPSRTIPRAIVIALGATIVIYLIVGGTVMRALGPVLLSQSSAPLADAVGSGPWPWAVVVVRIGAALASGGALLALVAGVGRTTLAMAREGDLPRWLAAVHPRFHTPYRAEIALAVVVVALVLLTDVRSAIGFSSFGVLLYYFVANVAAWRQPGPQRRLPRWLQVVGAAGCAVLALALPWQSVLAGALVVLVGVLLRALRRRGR